MELGLATGWVELPEDSWPAAEHLAGAELRDNCFSPPLTSAQERRFASAMLMLMMMMTGCQHQGWGEQGPDAWCMTRSCAIVR